MSQNVSDKVDVAGAVVEIGGEGAAELVRADARFERRSNRGVLLDDVLHGTLGDAAPLKRQEKGVLMTWECLDFLAIHHVFSQSFRNLWREIQNHLIAALSGYKNRIILQVYVRNVDADAFRNTNA